MKAPEVLAVNFENDRFRVSNFESVSSDHTFMRDRKFLLILSKICNFDPSPSSGKTSGKVHFSRYYVISHVITCLISESNFLLFFPICLLCQWSDDFWTLDRSI